MPSLREKKTEISATAKFLLTVGFLGMAVVYIIWALTNRGELLRQTQSYDVCVIIGEKENCD